MTQLRVEGEVQSPRDFSFADLTQLPGQVPDVEQLIPGREGRGVQLQSILKLVGPTEAATHITLESSDGKFSASVPLEAVRNAIIAYRLENEPLPPQKGGPLRFFVPSVEECAVGGVDACANVKFLGLIRLSHGPGADTRPTTTAEHEDLHHKGGHEHLDS